MKQYLLLSVVTAISIVLTACGGSSSDKNRNSSNQTTDNGVAVQKTQTISLQAYSYQCGIEYPYQADVVFHDKNGESLGSAKTNEQGIYSDAVPAGTMHISVLADEIEYDFEEYTLIKSELDIQDRTNLGKFDFYSYKADCGCETYELDTFELGNIGNDYSLQTSYGTTLTDRVSVCPADKKLYFMAVANNGLDVKAAVLDIPQDSYTVKLKESDFSHQGVEVLPSNSQYHSYAGTRGYFLAEHKYRYVHSTGSSGFDPLYIFPSVTEHNFYVRNQSESRNVDNVDVDFFSYARNSVNGDGSYTLTDLPAISEGLATSLLQFANNSNLEYDFSNADSRFGRSLWVFNFLVGGTQESRFEWEVNGGIRGQIPDLSFGDVFPEPEGAVKLEQLELLLFGYAGNATDKATYTQLSETISAGGHLTKPEFSNYVDLGILAKFD
ncbi:hypothetical protein [Pseudoalteromonas ostreae]|uniref:hypothetical protein n=1 Tax=Pseudoalteromonas ostreae TaxID=2774154 RepID=UPI001B370DC8|nr:hypothetical protein [Pseudoalteromonas ostreae]